MRSADVLVWLGKSPIPVKAGDFLWDEHSRLGKFSYSQEYLSLPNRYALDPIALPLKRGQMMQTVQHGIFGAFRDSGPDSWGRGELERRLGDLDELDFLVKSGFDGAGALSLGYLKDFSPGYQYYRIEDLNNASRQMFDSNQPHNASQELNLALKPTTSLGGAKPKMTVEHDGELWIAKFPERGDHKFLPQNEHVMLRLAEKAGLNVPESFVHHLPDGRYILMVKRFDRDKVDGGYSRTPYVSAHTVLGISGDVDRDKGKKSYLALADASRRWAALEHRDLANELWDRIVFNGLVGNIDDHSRNHGLLYSKEKKVWELSPAFDIVAFPSKGNVVLSLTFTPKQGALVTKETLLESARYLGVDEVEAQKRLKDIASVISSSWEDELIAAGADKNYINYLKPSFNIASEIESKSPKRITIF